MLIEEKRGEGANDGKSCHCGLTSARASALQCQETADEGCVACLPNHYPIVIRSFAGSSHS